jgi:tetratricopeptide (TPR) repeat protein/DNA-binding CsgD family transcriptional regulator
MVFRVVEKVLANRRVARVWFVLFLTFCCVYLYSSLSVTDSLESRLSQASGHERLLLLSQLAKANLEESPARSIDFATEALNLSRELKNQQEEANALFYLAEASVIMNNLEESIPFYLESAEIEKRLHGPESEGYATRLGDAGYCYYTITQMVTALDYMQTSLDISVRNNYDGQAASMYSNIGSLYTEWGDYSKGLENHLKALEIDRRHEDIVQVAIDLNNIGKIYEQWGKYEDAINYYKESLEIAEKTGNRQMVAIRLNNLGISFKELDRFPEALDYFQQALAIERALGNEAKVGRRLANIGSVYLEMEDYAKCNAYLNQALPLLTKSALIDDLARLYNIYGRYYSAVRQYPAALESFRESQELAVINHLKPLELGNLKGMSEVYERMGRFDSALSCHKQFMEIKDSVFTQESDTKLAEFQTLFKSEKMQLENEMLKKDAKMKREIYLFSGIGAVLLLFVLISIILILRLRARNARQARQMAEQQAEQLRLDLELKNKELTYNAMSIIKKNETVSDMIGSLEKAIKEGQPVELLSSVFEKIRNGDRDSGWKEFELRFTQVHKEFYDKMNLQFPGLTPNERKLCAFLRLNMTTKDIASITHQSVHSINVARTRLRKKLNLSNSDENLISFLINL